MDISQAHLSPTHDHLRVLFVDDEMPVLKALNRFARNHAWSADIAQSGAEALHKLARQDFDIVVSDMCMPNMDGATLLQQVRSQYPQTIRILLTGHADVDKMGAAINRGGIFNYLSKPWDGELMCEMLENAFHYRNTELQRAHQQILNQQQITKLGLANESLEHKVKERTLEIEQAFSLISDLQERTSHKYSDALMVLNKVIQWRFGEFPDKNKFVQDNCTRLAQRLELPQNAVDNLTLATQLYRIGVLILPNELPAKPINQFTPEQTDSLAQIPFLGDIVLSGVPGLREVAAIIRHQNENIDGSGAPGSLKQDEIPIESRILRLINDFYDLFQGHLVSKVYGIKSAISYIKDWSDIKYDNMIVSEFLAMLDEQHDDEATYTKVESLSVGMQLQANVVSKNGTILLLKGTVLKRHHIEDLKLFEVDLNESFVIKVKPLITLL